MKSAPGIIATVLAAGALLLGGCAAPGEYRHAGDGGARYDAQGNRMDGRGYYRDAQGNRTDDRGYRIEQRGYQRDSQGNWVDERGNRYDAQGYWIDERGIRHEYQDSPRTYQTPQPN